MQTVERSHARKAFQSDRGGLADDVARVGQAIAKRRDGGFVVGSAERDRCVRADSKVVGLPPAGRVFQTFCQKRNTLVGSGT